MSTEKVTSMLNTSTDINNEALNLKSLSKISKKIYLLLVYGWFKNLGLDRAGKIFVVDFDIRDFGSVYVKWIERVHLGSSR